PRTLHILSVLAPLLLADAAPRCGGSSRPERPLPPLEDTTGGETSGAERSPGSGELSALVGVVDRRA
ncbi:MAG TPA: hypothetical protein PK095_19890, partial [Myxococcota bacterium]|nr:hypothetical protein [Myxococcota bacterium]